MNVYHEVWVRRLLERKARMADMQIMVSAAKRTGFFASTRLFAIGDTLALLRAGNDVATMLGSPPNDPSAHLWEVKYVGPRPTPGARWGWIRRNPVG